MQAFVFVECAVGQDSAVREHLRRLEGVAKAYPVGSIYDLVVKVQAPAEALIKRP